MTNEEAKAFLNNLKVCIEEHPIVADWLVEIANRKTENSSEKPNNCEPQTDMAEDIVRSFGFKTESYRQAKAKDEPIDRDDLGNCNICKYVGLEHRCNQCVNGSMFCKVEDEPQTERSGVLFRGELEEGDYRLIKTTDGWVLQGEDIVFCGWERSE